MNASVIRICVMAIVAGLSATASAQYLNPYYQQAQYWYGLRHYYGYPYQYSTGLRYDPYWSYNASYFPETYNGDGSYYGIGYSGYNGDGYYGSYYYW